MRSHRSISDRLSTRGEDGRAGVGVGGGGGGGSSLDQS